MLQNYRIVGRLGEGTFSEVLKCQSLVDGKLYACKKMKQKYDSGGTQCKYAYTHVVQLFDYLPQRIEQVNNLREVQALRRLNPHPHIIDLKEVVLDRKSRVLALICELMDMNIYELIKDRKTYLPEQRVKLYMYQLCKSIYHMHRNGIFHRDVKPENILVKDNVLKLADFGSCKSVYSKQPYTEYISTRWYRAPECLLTDGFYDYKMDMWSVGCVMFEAMCLRPLFPGSNELDQVARIHEIIGSPSPALLEKFRKHQSRHMDFNFPYKYGLGISSLMKHASKGCADLVMQLCAYDPDERLSAKHALRHPYFKDIRDAERKARQLATSPSIASTRLLAVSKKKHHHHTHDQIQRAHHRHRRPQHLQAVPEYYTGPPGVSYVGRQHPAHIGGEATLTLPQIEAKSYHPHPSHPHLSTYPSGLTSMVVSNKSTSHGAYLPTIYSEKTSAKDVLYPPGPRHHHHRHHHHQRQHVPPAHLPTITSSKHPHHTRTGAG